MEFVGFIISIVLAIWLIMERKYRLVADAEIVSLNETVRLQKEALQATGVNRSVSISDAMIESQAAIAYIAIGEGRAPIKAICDAIRKTIDLGCASQGD